MSQKLGTCCICGGNKAVNNIIMLDLKSPTPGHGWGCVVCNVPSDGASAVVCDGCVDAFYDGANGLRERLRFVCTGYPATEGRTPIELVTETFGHDMSRHAEVER